MGLSKGQKMDRENHPRDTFLIQPTGMIIIGTISFLLGVFSMLISLYIHSLGKRDIKGLRYFEIW